MNTNTVLTDEQIIEAHQSLPPTYHPAQFARAIEQATLQSLEIQELRQRVEDMEKIVGECRDAMPIPDVGSQAEECWPDAMSHAEGVPGFVKASIEALRKDAERLDWLADQEAQVQSMNKARGDPVYRIGWPDDGEYRFVWHSNPREAIDAAMEKQP